MGITGTEVSKEAAKMVLAGGCSARLEMNEGERRCKKQTRHGRPAWGAREDALTSYLNVSVYECFSVYV